jgi:hypothetical protein
MSFRQNVFRPKIFAEKHSIRQAPAAKCGHTPITPHLHASLRIVNGLEAKPHSFPWAVSLQHNGKHVCGGVIIDRWHILTAAHCPSYSHDLSNYQARIGAHHRSSSGQLMHIDKVIRHPNYNPRGWINDIAIILLAEPIVFSNTVQPICLVNNVSSKIRRFSSCLTEECYRTLSIHHLIRLSMLLDGAILYMETRKVLVRFFCKHAFALSPTVRCIRLTGV